MKNIKKLVIGTLMATLVGAGATMSLLGTGCATDQSAHDGALRTTFRGKQYEVKVANVSSTEGNLAAEIQLVGGPKFKLKIDRDGDAVVAELASSELSYSVRTSPRMVSSEYATLKNGELVSSQYLFGQPNNDPSLGISKTVDKEDQRVLQDETLHGTLTNLLQSLGNDPAAGQAIELISQVDMNIGFLRATKDFTKGVIAANLEQVNPPPPRAPLICDTEPLPTTEQPNPVPPTMPTGDTPMPTPTAGSAAVHKEGPPNCGKTCNLTKGGSSSGPDLSLDIAGGIVKLEGKSVVADLSATAWNTDLLFNIGDKAGESGKIDNSAGIICITDGKQNDYQWNSFHSEVWAEAYAQNGSVCASPNDKDHANAGQLELKIDGAVEIKHKACATTCDGVSKARSQISGDLSGCWRKSYWYESGKYKYYMVSGSGSVTCDCN